MGIRPGTGSLPGCAYFLMNTRGSTTQRLNKVAKTAPAAMISITSFRSSNWILQTSIPPNCYQQFANVLILCYIPARVKSKTLPAPKSIAYRNRHSHESGNPDQPGTLTAQDYPIPASRRPRNSRQDLLLKQQPRQNHPKPKQPRKNAPGNQNLHNSNPPA